MRISNLINQQLVPFLVEQSPSVLKQILQDGGLSLSVLQDPSKELVEAYEAVCEAIEKWESSLDGDEKEPNKLNFIQRLKDFIEAKRKRNYARSADVSLNRSAELLEKVRILNDSFEKLKSIA